MGEMKRLEIVLDIVILFGKAELMRSTRLDYSDAFHHVLNCGIMEEIGTVVDFVTLFD